MEERCLEDHGRPCQETTEVDPQVTQKERRAAALKAAEKAQRSKVPTSLVPLEQGINGLKEIHEALRK